MKVICEAAWACAYKDACVIHGREHSPRNDCAPGLCASQPQIYRNEAGRRRKIRCETPEQAALKAQKRRDARVAFGT